MPRSEPGKPLLDALSAADKRELLPGLSAKSPAGIPSGSSLV
jgi:hypothetical protein